jgi:hypothetical protein
MLCHDCGSTIEEGRKDRAPVLARFCLKCRSERRRHCNISMRGSLSTTLTSVPITTADFISVVASSESWLGRLAFRAGTSSARRGVSV